MWCDNCLLILPLRAGSMAWAIFLAAYSIAGGIFLLLYGNHMFFFYPEWFIYGGISLAIAAIAVINILALSNRSYTWTKVCKMVWPFIIIISLIRAILMIVQLQRGKEKIAWGCENGGAIWTAEGAAAATPIAGYPAGFCYAGFKNLNTAFIVSLLVDLVVQFYMFFLAWRYQKRLEHYSAMKPMGGGGYYA